MKNELLKKAIWRSNYIALSSVDYDGGFDLLKGTEQVIGGNGCFTTEVVGK